MIPNFWLVLDLSDHYPSASVRFISTESVRHLWTVFSWRLLVVLRLRVLIHELQVRHDPAQPVAGRPRTTRTGRTRVSSADGETTEKCFTKHSKTIIGNRAVETDGPQGRRRFNFYAEQETVSFVWQPNSIKSIISKVAHKGHSCSRNSDTNTKPPTPTRQEHHRFSSKCSWNLFEYSKDFILFCYVKYLCVVYIYVD